MSFCYRCNDTTNFLKCKNKDCEVYLCKQCCDEYSKLPPSICFWCENDDGPIKLSIGRTFGKKR